MRRDQLEHIIRAAADVTGENDFIVIGSQAILGQYPGAPDPLLISMEADLYPLARPELSEYIEVHDIGIAKYVAGREKDLRYTAALWEAGLLDRDILAERLRSTELMAEHRDRIASTIRRQQRLHDTGRRSRLHAPS